MEIAKHQQPRKRQSLLLRFRVLIVATDITQEIDPVQLGKRMFLLSRREKIAIPFQRGFIDVIESRVRNNHVIKRLELIGNHAPHDMLGHMVVSFVLPPVGLPEHVFVQVDRLVGAIRTRHLDDNHRFAVAINDLHVLVRQDIHADLVAVVERVREVLDKFLGIAHTDNLKMLVLKLLHAQENHPAVGVAKGRIRLPKAARQTALRLLALQMECLTLTDQGIDVLFRPLHC